MMEFCQELEGDAFGLCNAFCNAQQCHISPKPSCELLRENFESLTGQSTFPCEAPVSTPTDTPVITTPTSTATATGTSAAVISGECSCDCDDDGEISINDLLRSVLVALGHLQLSDCGGMADHEAITIQDLIRGVRDALEGCS
jgi:hypothetical protein